MIEHGMAQQSGRHTGTTAAPDLLELFDLLADSYSYLPLPFAQPPCGNSKVTSTKAQSQIDSAAAPRSTYLRSPAGLALFALGEHLLALRIVDGRSGDRFHRRLRLDDGLRFASRQRRVDLFARRVRLLDAAAMIWTVSVCLFMGES